MAIIHLHC